MERLDAEHKPLLELTIGRADLVTTRRFATGEVQHYEHDNGSHFIHNERDHVCTRHADEGTTHYTYNGRDQLEKIHGPGLLYEALFDGLGRRIRKTVNGKVTHFYWDGDRLAAEVGPSGEVRVYVYADSVARTPLAFVDYASLQAEPSSGQRYMVFCTHQGCPERVVDANGETVWSASIEAYGLAKVEMGAGFHQPLRWPGHYFDDETRLQDNRFRTYDPVLGRYLQSDPVGLEGGLNVYAYTENPLRDVDLRGYNGNADCPECQNTGEKCSACESANERKGIVRGRSVGAKGTRTKNRLPEGRNGDLGPPNGKLERRNPQTGELQQIRTYDGNGQPCKDIDFGHDHNGAGDPHAHDWTRVDPRQPNPVRGMLDQSLQEKSMTNLECLHDGEIEQIRFERVSRKLEIGVKTTNDGTITIRCTAVVGFEFDAFGEQNVLFAVHRYQGLTMPDYHLVDLDSYSQDALRRGCVYINLESSVGMGGWLVAQAVDLLAEL